MLFNTRSSPSSGDLVGMIGSPFSKKIIGVFIGSNFSGAHHLEYNSKVYQNRHVTFKTNNTLWKDISNFMFL
jgi:hypothetical protein